MERPVVLTVAGSDSAGMAGLQMDLKVQHAMGVHCASAVTACTAQNSVQVLGINPVSARRLRQQLQAIEVLRPKAVKAGLLADTEQVRELCALLDRTGLPLVCDPVLKSSTGRSFADNALVEAVKNDLLGRCTLITPNLEELARLTGRESAAPEDVEAAARSLTGRNGAGAVLVKGGHGAGEYCRDYFCSEATAFWLSSPRRDASNSRGTGCALASAAAAALALDYEITDAVVIGKMAVNQGLRQGYACGGQKGPVHVTGFPDRLEDMPALHLEAEYRTPPQFLDCGETPLGLYPIVDRADWLPRLAPQGVSTVQLRIKDLEGQALSDEIARAVALARQYDCRLFINDHWREALEHGAYGVHVGQQDVHAVDLTALRRAGLRLGISTHCHREVAAAHAHRPSYLACGPVYHTTTKDMPWIPHGPDGLAYWQRTMAPYPVVAIGGINRERITDVAAAGVDGIAVITAITQARDPEASARELIGKMREEQRGI